MNRLECLPEELETKIWCLVFPYIGEMWKEINAVLRARYVSRHTMKHLDKYLFGAVDAIHHYVIARIRDDVLLLFTNVKSLFLVPCSLIGLSTITIAGLRQMTWLERLILPSGHPASKELQSLTHLKKLDLRLPCEIERYALTCLTQLEYLSLSSNHAIKDRHLTCLIHLKGLVLLDDVAITGKCLSPLVNLEHLHLGYVKSTFKESALFDMGHRLKSLVLDNCRGITDKSVSQMTNLQTLRFIENRTISGSTLQQLPSLRSLTLVDEKCIDASDLSRLTWLRELSVRDYDNYREYKMDASFIKPLRRTLRKLVLTSAPYTNLVDLLQFEQLQNFTYLTYAQTTGDYDNLFEELKKKGVTVSLGL